MKIGIIGAGQIGGTLTRRLRALGHEVHVANSRDPRTLASLVTETGAVAVEAKEAPRGVDLVIVTIPERNVPTLPKGLFAGVPASVVVVDTGNYYPRQRDGRIVEIESGMPESRWAEQKLGRPVIKAFNNIYARHLLERGRPRGSPGRIALPVAGDDAKAKAVVLQLVDELGFDAVDAGGLDDSWRQQPGTPVYTTDLDAEGVRKALSAARRQRTPEPPRPKAPATLPIRRERRVASVASVRWPRPPRLCPSALTATRTFFCGDTPISLCPTCVRGAGSSGSGSYSTSPAISAVSQVWQTPVRQDHLTGTSHASASSSRL